MHYQDLDAYFYMATKGDRNAYDKLYDGFVSRCNSIVKSIVENTSNFQGFPEDFSETVDDLFFRALREYNLEKGAFTFFANFVIKTRLISKVMDVVALIQTKGTDIETHLNDNHTMEDVIADPNQKPMHQEIALKDFKLKISSPSNHKTKDNRVIDRILLLQYAGYKNSEICKYLKFTYSQLRRYLDKIKDHDELINFKIDLK